MIPLLLSIPKNHTAKTLALFWKLRLEAVNRFKTLLSLLNNDGSLAVI
jgi:hypothetical protein